MKKLFVLFTLFIGIIGLFCFGETSRAARGIGGSGGGPSGISVVTVQVCEDSNSFCPNVTYISPQPGQFICTNDDLKVIACPPSTDGIPNWLIKLNAEYGVDPKTGKSLYFP